SKDSTLSSESKSTSSKRGRSLKRPASPGKGKEASKSLGTRKNPLVVSLHGYQPPERAKTITESMANTMETKYKEATVIADGKLEDLTEMCSKVISDMPESFKTVLGWRPLRDGCATELSDLLNGFKLEKDILDIESISTDTVRERCRLMREEFKEVLNVYEHGDALLAESEALSPIALGDFVATPIWNPPKLKKPRATTPMAVAVTSSDSGGLERSFIANRILNSARFQYRIAPPRFDATTE
ncbi:hypothetical protein BGX26_003712, partial [Mortierella sp. AD094]